MCFDVVGVEGEEEEEQARSLLQLVSTGDVLVFEKEDVFSIVDGGSGGGGGGVRKDAPPRRIAEV